MNRIFPSTRPAIQRLAIILAVVVQIGAGFLPRFGIGEFIGARSDAVRTLITPAGWAFAIWGIGLYLVTGVSYFLSAVKSIRVPPSQRIISIQDLD